VGYGSQFNDYTYWGFVQCFGSCFSSCTTTSIPARNYTIPAIIDRMPVNQPFAGGFEFSLPTFADIENDGDFDLFVGESPGNINFYRNTGVATNPIFKFETENFASIDIGLSSAPSFADIDNDGDFDLFVGEFEGSINFYRNTGTTTNPNFTFETPVFASIDVGAGSRPIFSDIDNDGDLDLFVGENARNINFYRNRGTPTNPNFTL